MRVKRIEIIRNQKTPKKEINFTCLVTSTKRFPSENLFRKRKVRIPTLEEHHEVKRGFDKHVAAIPLVNYFKFSTNECIKTIKKKHN